MHDSTTCICPSNASEDHFLCVISCTLDPHNHISHVQEWKKETKSQNIQPKGRVWEPLSAPKGFKNRWKNYIRNGAALTTIGSGQKMHTSYAETMFSYSVGTIFAMLSGKLLLPQLAQKLSGLKFGPPFCQFWLRFERLRAYK